MLYSPLQCATLPYSALLSPTVRYSPLQCATLSYIRYSSLPSALSSLLLPLVTAQPATHPLHSPTLALTAITLSSGDSSGASGIIAGGGPSLTGVANLHRQILLNRQVVFAFIDRCGSDYIRYEELLVTHCSSHCISYHSSSTDQPY